jgi:5'-nucleotidase
MAYHFKKSVLAASIAVLSFAGGLPSAHAAASSLTLFHNNDGESKLLGSGDFGGFDYFLGELNAARDSARGAGRDVLTVSSGDNFLAGLAWRASVDRRFVTPAGGGDPVLDRTVPFASDLSNNYYDAMALASVGYDAITLGNHDFDFGPDVLADFITGYKAAGGTASFISSNLDFTGESSLQDLKDFGDIATSTIVTENGNQYGIIGATTTGLDFLSSPGNVTAGDVAAAVNAEVDALEAAGVNRIILSSHLQSLNREQELVPLLRGVDVIIAGGGDELLTNEPDANTEARFGPDIDGPYPLVSEGRDVEGNKVAIVTTAGEYRYIGRLEVEFDDAGEVSMVGLGDSGAILVDPNTSPRAVGEVNGIDIQGDILDPLAADVADLQKTPVGTTEVNLDGVRGSVRTMETNLGNLITDAFVWQAQELGGLTGDPVVAVTNGGGIRNDSVLPAGETLTVADVIDTLPFANSVVTLNGVTVADLVAALENAVSRVEDVSGRFLQVSGLAFTYNPDPDLDPGERLISVELSDGTPIWTKAAGDLFGGTFDIVTNSFLAGGGDGYDVFTSYLANDLSVNYGDALAAFIEEELGGVIGAGAYPEGGMDRISAVPLPGAVWLFAGALGLLGVLRRRGTA